MALEVITWPAPGTTELSHSVFDPQRELFHGGRDEWLLAPPMRGLDRWSVLARSREAQRRAREVLRAFVGPAVAEFQKSDERSQLEFGSSSYEVFVTPLLVHDAREEQMVAAAERLVNVHAGQPAQVPIGRASVSALLRDFRLALAHGDSESATDQLQQLQEHPQLSRMNRQFLKVEFLARLGRWTELRGLEWFVSLLQQRRPASITEYMLEAVWHITFEQEGAHSWAEAEVAFAGLPDAIRTASDGIDPSRNPSRRLAALRASEQGSVLRLEVLIAADPSLEPWMKAETTAVVPEAGHGVAQVEGTAAGLLDSGRIADLIDLVEKSNGRPADLSFAVRGVVEYESTEFAPKVVAWLDQTEPKDLPGSPGFRRAVATVRSLAEDRCDGWSEWFRRVACEGHWSAAAEVARNGVEKWGLADLGDRHAREESAGNLEAAIEGPNAQSIDQVLDLLCSIVASLVERHGADALVGAVSVALVYRTPSAKTVGALAQLVEVVLEHSPTESVYRDLTEACSQEEVVKPRAHIASLLDLLDAFVAGVRIEPHFGSFVGAAQNALIAHRSNGRLDGEERRLAAELLAEAGRPTGSLEPDEVEATVDDPWAALAGKTVFLYTLLNGLSARFEDRLKQRCPSVQVTCSQEKHASDRLRKLAAGADFVVVHTRHASHAATIGIDQVVAKSEQLLVNGKGLSSTLITLRDALPSVPA
jgi:hypothetical protein